MATVDDDLIAQVAAALENPRHDVSRAAAAVPRTPGLYAFYGDQTAWTDLGLTPGGPDHPLYVGKAERSLNGRDVSTHFATGKTGSSTLRRSLAALLAPTLGLRATPRNLARPDGSANYSLAPDGDAALSRWMEEHLQIATWTKSADVSLKDIERAVIHRLDPPLNLDGVLQPRERLRAARRSLAAEARAWPGHGGSRTDP